MKWGDLVAEIGHPSTWNKQNLFTLKPEWKHGGILFIAFPCMRLFYALTLSRLIAEWTNDITMHLFEWVCKAFFFLVHQPFTFTATLWMGGIIPMLQKRKLGWLRWRDLLRFSQLENDKAGLEPRPLSPKTRHFPLFCIYQGGMCELQVLLRYKSHTVSCQPHAFQ